MSGNGMATLSALQREHWAVDGYLHLKGALAPDEVAFFSDQIDRIRGLPGYEPAPGELPLGHYKWVEHGNPDPASFMDRRDLLAYHQAFIDLIDRPNVFDLIVDIMGPYLQFSMSQAIVRASTETFPGYTHTDGGEGQRRVRVTETSRPIAVKVMYLLTDVAGNDSGNFTLFPGSHMRPFPESAARAPNPHAPGAVQLRGKAGDAYLFPTPSGTAPPRTTRARHARRSSTTTARCSSAPTTTPPRATTSSPTAPRANAASSATSATPSAPARTFMCPRIRRR